MEPGHLRLPITSAISVTVTATFDAAAHCTATAVPATVVPATAVPGPPQLDDDDTAVLRVNDLPG